MREFLRTRPVWNTLHRSRRDREVPCGTLTWWIRLDSGMCVIRSIIPGAVTTREGGNVGNIEFDSESTVSATHASASVSSA
jgi:hypothetical protein